MFLDNDFYVCDFKGHCVAVFQEDGTFQYRIGNEKVTCFPNGIDISNAGDILIGDSHGNRFHVACYSRDGVLQSEFECPHVKVSWVTVFYTPTTPILYLVKFFLRPYIYVYQKVYVENSY